MLVNIKISYCENTWGQALVAMPDVQSSFNIRCDSLHDEVLIRLKGIGIVLD